MQPGQQLSSSDGQTVLKFQTDGNVVLYKSGVAAWSTNTKGSMLRLTMQTDCKLVLFAFSVTVSGTAAWSSTATSTSNCAGSYVSVDAGTAAVYNSAGVQVWRATTWDNTPTAAPKPPTPTTRAPVPPSSSPTATGSPVRPSTAAPPAPITRRPTPPATSVVRVASLGCYADSATRAFVARLSAAPNAIMRDCAFLAYRQGYTHFGLEYGGECWGGTALALQYGLSSACTMPCIAEPSKMCGGRWAFNAYQILTPTQSSNPAVTADLPAPPASGFRSEFCRTRAGSEDATYCWRCTNNVDNNVACFDATITDADGASQQVADLLCDPDRRQPADICAAP